MLSDARENGPCDDYHIAGNTDLPVEQVLDAIMFVMDSAFDANYGEAWNRKQLLSTLVLPGCHYSLAFKKDEPAGFSFSRRVDVEEELLLLAIHPDYQNTGLAHVIMKQFLEDSRNNAVSRIFLEVRANNPAKFLYQKHGFSEIGRRRDYYVGKSGQSYDAISMMLVL